MTVRYENISSFDGTNDDSGLVMRLFCYKIVCC